MRCRPLVALGANDAQLEFPIIYVAARDGYAKYEMSDENKNLSRYLKRLSSMFPLREVLKIHFNFKCLPLIMTIMLEKSYLVRIFNGTVKKMKRSCLPKPMVNKLRYRVSKLIGFHWLGAY